MHFVELLIQTLFFDFIHNQGISISSQSIFMITLNIHLNQLMSFKALLKSLAQILLLQLEKDFSKIISCNFLNQL